MNIDLIREAFGPNEFDTREASAVLGASIATSRTLLNEMRTKGYLVRVRRGRYRVAEKPTNLNLDRRRAKLRLDLALEAPLHIGLDGPDAVDLWTRGRYTVRSEPNALHIAVAAEDETAYRKYLKDIGLKVGEGHKKPHVVLRIIPESSFTELEGKPVLDRESVIRIIHDNPVAYDGAEKWLVMT